MKNIWLGAVALMAAGAANAAWVVDGTTLSDAETGWALTVSNSKSKLTISAVVSSPSTESPKDLDFSVMPNGYTVVGINNEVFQGNKSVARVIAPDLTSLGRRAFRNSSITSFKADSLGLVQYAAFRGCISLVTLDLPNCKTINGGTDINYGGVAECTALTTVNVPNLKKIEVRGFYGCTSLKEISLPSCTDVGKEVFAGCSSLETVSLSVDVSSIGVGCFQNCKKLCNLAPTTFASLTTLGDTAFNNCAALTGTLDFPQVTSISGSRTFMGAGLEEVRAENLKTISNGAGNYGAFYQNAKLKRVYFPNVRIIGNYNFWNCTNLTEVTPFRSIAQIGQYAFDSCSNLKQIDLTAAADETTPVSLSSYAFSYLPAGAEIFWHGEAPSGSADIRIFRQPTGIKLPILYIDDDQFENWKKFFGTKFYSIEAIKEGGKSFAIDNPDYNYPKKALGAYISETLDNFNNPANNGYAWIASMPSKANGTVILLQ